MCIIKFQSTRPVWGATDGRDADIYGANGFNPRAPCGARLTTEKGDTIYGSFNPRAPCGARRDLALVFWSERRFQSTRPVWGATPRQRPRRPCRSVSIHAPRVGRDFVVIVVRILTDIRFNPRAPCGARRRARLPPGSAIGCFNPRAPCGARLQARLAALEAKMFQSTRPVWGATATGVTTSPFCHVFMGIPLHKYDFLGT